MAYRKTPQQGETIVGQAVALIKEAIRDGRLAPGQRLVATDLATDLAISGGTLREALRKLTGEGLVVVEPHRGAVVRRLDAADIREIFELRAVIEGLAARLAAERAKTDPAIGAEIMAAAEATRATTALGLAAYVVANARFHKLVYLASGRERLAALADQLSLPIDRLRNRGLADPNAMVASAADHCAVAAAVAGGRAEEAESLMRSHVTRSACLVAAYL